ncbi:hypothetical protein RHS01_02732 [Rhizoctonia solani]|uniref:Uncharacterized protein n=1 Tax=Rhizoctonia solani TaxID=456999 RepID=A0A8H7M7G7_9AGAM|nr:hypothetical protein RHS01_02732 [Rhizoctonia solani]
MLFFGTLAVTASLVAAVAADHGHSLHARSHHHVDRSNLQKRFSGTATYYQTGMGACGQYNNPGDFIVALNSAQYGGGYPGPNCFKGINICGKGKCHYATIVDECPTCSHGSLDLSQGLFEFFAPTSDGVFQMTWSFADGGDDPKPTTSKKPDPPPPTTTWKPEPSPEPTTTWKPEPTTTWEEPKTTSTKRRTTTSTPPPEPTTSHEPSTTSTSYTPTSTPSSTSSEHEHKHHRVTATQSSAGPSSSGSVSVSAPAPTTSGLASGPGNNSGSGAASNLADANQVMLALGKMAVVANGGQ